MLLPTQIGEDPMSADLSYEAPAVTAVTPVDAPLIGSPIGSAVNPQWKDEADVF